MSGGAGIVTGGGFDSTATLTLTNAGTGLIVNGEAIIQKTLTVGASGIKFNDGTVQYTGTLSGSGAPTSIPSFVGQNYIDTSGKRKYTAMGISSSSDWQKQTVHYTTTFTITAGGGDKTITIPFDWTDGVMELFRSQNSDSFMTNSNDDGVWVRTTYDSITNAVYTNLQNNLNVGNTNQTSVRAKNLNRAANPKSATATTITFDDDTILTVYCKLHVWA